MQNQENVSSKNSLPTEIIDPQELPEIIRGKVTLLEDLEKQKKDACDNAKLAKEKADSMKSFVTKKFLWHEYESGDPKAIIKDMQDVIQNIAKAQETNAKATALSFEFMKQLSETSEYLFGLCCFNFAATEKMIEELTTYGQDLTGHNGISDAIKTKMLEVAKRLNMQKDLMLRQNKLEEKLREKDRELHELKEDIHQLKENASKNNTEIRSVLKKHKWLLWVMSGVIAALVAGLIIALL